MFNKPILITCQPDDDFFIWQNQLYIESCLEAGFEEERIHILLYTPPMRQLNNKWDKLKEHYPKLNIFRYSDGYQDFYKYLKVYIPLLRPHILWQHFETFPELEKETILYTDCDILWTKQLKIHNLLDDNVCYLSDAHGYMNHDYFNRKYNDVKEDKKEEAQNRDFLNELCILTEIPKDIVLENNKNIGGVQYILKGINSEFWRKVERDCLRIRTHLLGINREFYENENKGIQSWCADLWSVVFNLWFFKKEVKVIPEMNFAWSTDGIEKIKTVGIFHNAGIASENTHGTPTFYKGKYHRGLNPFTDPHLETVYNDENSKKLANWYYVSKLIEVKHKFNYK